MFLRFRRKTAVSALREGDEAVVEGTVVARDDLSLPMTDVRFVYFDKLNESFVHGQRGGGRRLWIPQSQERRTTGFFLDDGAGKVWIAADGESYSVSGAKEVSAVFGKQNRSRYVATVIRAGDRVRARGVVSRPKAAEPADGFVLRPDPKGRLEILVR